MNSPSYQRLADEIGADLADMVERLCPVTIRMPRPSDYWPEAAVRRCLAGGLNMSQTMQKTRSSRKRVSRIRQEAVARAFKPMLRGQ